MTMTMKSALAELAQSPQPTAGGVAHTVSHGALMGARGNSGVILSQLLRGMAKSLDRKETFSVKEFAAALGEASATAYKAVMKPVEGTILTVSRDVAAAANAAAAEVDDLASMLSTVVEEGRRSVARTQAMLPVLADAGVVDAGGQGLLTVLEGMMRFIRGDSVERLAISEPAHVFEAGGATEYGYEVQFVLQSSDLDLDAVRGKLDGMGDSLLVVGDSGTMKVHIHTVDPGAPLTFAASHGSLSQVTVENLQTQADKFLAAGRGAIAKAQQMKNSIEIVAVSPGVGITRVLESLGASAIVPGGQTMNPSTEELLRAVEGLRAEQVIILPNNSNIVLTARQVVGLSKKQVRVVASKTTPQGIGALLAFNYQADLETNAAIMENAAHTVRTVEVTRAVRSAQINGLKVEEGQIIALFDGALSASGTDVNAVIKEALDAAGVADCEIATVYYGGSVDRSEAQALADLLAASNPNVEFEVVEGGQPHYHYIISLE